jgi:hypothetical protein
MNMNPLPPQAYTKETLGKAFAWLQTQNENIKEMATSPDILVSLYLKAKLNGESALERPSIQNFKNELRSLAGMIGEFEPQEAIQAATMQATLEPQKKQTVEAPASSPAPARPIPPPPIPKTEHKPEWELDARSKAMIHEVKNELNLSSEQEAVRVMLSLGYKSIKKL